MSDMNTHDTPLQQAAKAVGATAKQRTLSTEFQARVRALSERARKVGSSLTQVCREGAVSRATPDRWLIETPKTIELFDRLEAIVARKEAEAANREPD